jgi:DNA replication protein DnaC
VPCGAQDDGSLDGTGCDLSGRLPSSLFCRCPHGRRRQTEMQTRIVGAFDRAGAPSHLKGLTLETLRAAARGDAEKANALRAAADFLASGAVVDEHGRERRGLFVHGPNGAGKTGLLVSVAHVLYDRGHTLLFIKYADLIRDIQSAYGQEDDVTGKMLADSRILTAQRTAYLFVDDLGDPFARADRYRETEDRRRIFFEVLSYRHERRMPVLISSNYRGLDELAAQFDPRTADRILESCAVVLMTGKNLRMGEAA